MVAPAIRIDGLGKEYQLGIQEMGYTTFREAIVNAVQAPWRRLKHLSGRGEDLGRFWALQDVGFDVEKGEVVGIIGRNGAGKSTLLKILSQITEPTTGEVQIRGRVASLLEVGTGFHPELTGRENMFLNGAILGMSRAEVKRKFDQIVEFSGVEKFLDTPVKRYSSGMHVRLAFAVAAHLEPEILVVDEVLAVGDAAFQAKCLGKMGEVARGGRTILFVSHNMAAIEALCSRAILLRDGKVVCDGQVNTVLSEYLSDASRNGAVVDLTNHRGRTAGSSPVFGSLEMLDRLNRSTESICSGADITFAIKMIPHEPLLNGIVVLRITGPLGERVTTLHSKYQCARSMDLEAGTVVRCTMHNCRLMPGRYQVSMLIRRNGQTVDEIATGLGFDVLQADLYGTGKLPSERAGFLLPEVTWQW